VGTSKLHEGRRDRPGRAEPAAVDIRLPGSALRRRAAALVPDSALRHRAALDRGVRVLVNLLGAASAAWFARASFVYYTHTHRLIGGLFLIEQAWFLAIFLLRRPARSVSLHLGSWLLAAGGTFGGLLLRPTGYHPLWGVRAGLVLQVGGLLLAIVALVALGRSFGFVAADRGLVTRGPYAVVRHPVYAGYLLIQGGYVLQAMSWRNVAVLLFATACNIGRMVAEERLLCASAPYDSYRRRVRWRLIPGVW
jgi:protein-S-isoprenylcysteine O-methyltransferase Ste14